jgi:hypothetical protein
MITDETPLPASLRRVLVRPWSVGVYFDVSAGVAGRVRRWVHNGRPCVDANGAAVTGQSACGGDSVWWWLISQHVCMKKWGGSETDARRRSAA